MQQSMSNNQNKQHLLSSLFSKTTWVNQHQQSKTILDFKEAADDGAALVLSG